MLLVGLGNPGPSYRSHRHNVGFMVLERLHSLAGASEWREKYSSLTAKGVLAGQPVTLLLPQSFMNLSGTSVQKASTDLRFTPAKIIVVHDELELPFGQVRAKFGGGHAGHNGLRDITAKLGPEFARIRVGIGRPTIGAVDSYVLSPFSKEEQAELSSVIDRAASLVELALRDGIEAAIEKSNPPAPKSGKKRG
ncbi:MAG: aminoacyl-tRNA hydrolase [Polyangiales bacterium]